MKILKTAITILSIFAVATFAIPTPSFAEIPKLISYQGKLTDSSGKPVPDGTYSITFRIYEQESGGNPLWSETQTVTAQKGIFSTQIGATKDLNLAFDKPYYLGIKVGTDTEMSPRQRLSSSAYAFRAKEADHATTAATLDDTTKLLPSGVIVMWSGSISSIPPGWHLCDGTAGTPDLRDRFIFGAGGAGTVSNHGPDGSSSRIDTTLYGSGNDIYMKTNTQPMMGPMATPGPNSATAAHSHNFMPKYYVLAFIMKL